MWVGAILTSALFVVAAINSAELSVGFLIGLSVVILGITYWHHNAIVNRNLTQITILAVLNFIPLGNIIGCLIMVSIRRATQKELELYDFSSTGT